MSRGVGTMVAMTMHEKAWGDSREWFTPSGLFDALGIRFDLDPASPMSGPVPWVPADRFYSPRENGLTSEWSGRVWLNPPYGPALVPFVHRMVAHDNGILLVPARTETRWFQYAAPNATLVTFLRDRLWFTRADGFTGRASHASVLMAFGSTCADAVRQADLGWTFPSHPDGVWETTAGATNDECRVDWQALRDAPGYQRTVTGPSGNVWTWRAY